MIVVFKKLCFKDIEHSQFEQINQFRNGNISCVASISLCEIQISYITCC